MDIGKIFNISVINIGQIISVIRARARVCVCVCVPWTKQYMNTVVNVRRTKLESIRLVYDLYALSFCMLLCWRSSDVRSPKICREVTVKHYEPDSVSLFLSHC